MEELFFELKQKVYEKLDINLDVSDEDLYKVIDVCIYEISQHRAISVHNRELLRQQLYNSIKRLDILQELLEDDDITEIMINGYKDIFIEKTGRITKWNKQFESREKLEDIAQRIAAMSNKTINEAIPIVDTRLADGSRVNMVLSPIAIDGPVITIRKFYDTPIDIDRLIELGSITKEAADFLELLVKCRYNIFVSGGTGSGKTTFLNALSNFIPKDERIITIEDSAELQIKNAANLVRLEARNANVEGKNEVTIRDLLKASLRMRPDRIIVGEIRGAEAIDMLQAMNTGHDGSLSTGHSNSAKDMISRLETMVLMGMDMPSAAVKQQIASAIDLIVHLGRMRDKSRKVLQIAEVLNLQNGEIPLRTIYEFEEQGKGEDGKVEGKLVRRAETLENNAKMAAAGITGY